MARTGRQRLGQAGETLALEHLQRAGLTLVAENFHCRGGELDLVMRDATALVIVEVRYRGPGSRLAAAETVSPAKQRRIVRATEYFLARHRRFSDCPLRFDVVCIDRGADGETRLQWLQDAFRPAW